MANQIDERFSYVPAVKNYSNAMIRKNPTVNTGLLCESLYQTLLKRNNVTFKFNSFVSDYGFEQIGSEKHVN